MWIWAEALLVACSGRRRRKGETNILCSQAFFLFFPASHLLHKQWCVWALRLSAVFFTLHYMSFSWRFYPKWLTILLHSYIVNAATGSNSGLSVLLKDTSTRAGIEPPTPWLKDGPATHWPIVVFRTTHKYGGTELCHWVKITPHYASLPTHHISPETPPPYKQDHYYATIGVRGNPKNYGEMRNTGLWEKEKNREQAGGGE